MEIIGGLIFFTCALLCSSLKFVIEHERIVVFRMGRLLGVRGPGPVFLVPFIDKFLKVDLRESSIEIPLELTTADNERVTFTVVCSTKVEDSLKLVTSVTDAYVEVQKFLMSELTKRVGQFNSAEVAVRTPEIMWSLSSLLDRKTSEWGLRVFTVEMHSLLFPFNRQLSAPGLISSPSGRTNLIDTPRDSVGGPPRSHGVERNATAPPVIQSATVNAPSSLAAASASTDNHASRVAPAATAAIPAMPTAAGMSAARKIDAAMAAAPPASAAMLVGSAAVAAMDAAVSASAAMSSAPSAAAAIAAADNLTIPGQNPGEVFLAAAEKAVATAAYSEHAVTVLSAGQRDFSRHAGGDITAPQAVSGGEADERYQSQSWGSQPRESLPVFATPSLKVPGFEGLESILGVSAESSEPADAPDVEGEGLQALPLRLVSAVTGQPAANCKKCDSEIEGLLCFKCWEMN